MEKNNFFVNRVGCAALTEVAGGDQPICVSLTMGLRWWSAVPRRSWESWEAARSPPSVASQLQLLNRNMANPHEDQFLAAASHAFGMLQRAGERSGQPLHDGTHPGCLQDRVEIWRLRFRDGKWAHCGHLGDHPEVVFGLLAVPGLIFCAHCIFPALEHQTVTRPWECDTCEQKAVEFTEVEVTVGPLILAGNICPKCENESKGLS